MRNLIKVCFVSCTIGIGMWLYKQGYLPHWKPELKVSFQTVAPTYRNIVSKKVFSGRLAPCQTIQVASHLSGVLDQLLVSVGDHVKKGTPIARIQIRSHPADVEKATTHLRLASIALDQAKKKYLNSATLFKKKMLAKMEYEAVLASWKQANEKWNLAKKELEIAQQGYIKSTHDRSNYIKATRQGTILDLPIKDGGSVSALTNQAAGTTVATIGDTNQLLFQARVSEVDVIHLRKGMVFTIFLNANKEEKFQVRLTKIDPQADQKAADKGEVKFGIEGVLLNQHKAKSTLRSGYVAIAEIILDQAHHVLAIPEKLIQCTENDFFVWCLENGQKVQKTLNLGISDGFYAEVKSGIDVSDQLIIES